MEFAGQLEPWDIPCPVERNIGNCCPASHLPLYSVSFQLLARENIPNITISRGVV